ncbi:pilus assembly protein PilZ [Methylobacterium sp. J-048]|uniref:pilus assembly protein PilZ n=1 Tax=Methylobacterium sp. J-048 TaxID=2836635 RepID=UPI001FBBD63D|nr:pilus assembly protein PilZ [Methylobacterium sp. J-048]MCJ2054956.1 pilus assembly protein PilZ [Methylobacterium sp. J-048]
MQPEITLNGRAMLATGEEFACKVRNISVRSTEVVARVRAEIGQVVVCYIDDLGILPGKIAGLTSEGFVMNFSLKERRRERFAAQLKWQFNSAARSAELSRAPRIVPLDRAVEVRLGERIILTGTILNFSMSGAAIGLNGSEIPFVGARVRVGKRFATVVRLIDTGIAVQFVEPFAAHDFDERVRL